MFYGLRRGWYLRERLLNLKDLTVEWSAAVDYLLGVDLLNRGRPRQFENLIVAFEIDLVRHVDS